MLALAIRSHYSLMWGTGSPEALCRAARASARGVSQDKIGEVWRMMLSFSGYSFCKPHSASYARVSFQAAYLKAHFPAEFMAAVISNQGGFYSTFAYVSEARRLGLTVLPPDVNQSRIRWTGQRDSLRVGLMAIKGLSQKTQEKLLSARAQRPFSDFDDFVSRAHPAEDELRALVAAGAFESLHPGVEPAALLWRLARGRRARAGGQAAKGLFTTAPADAPPMPPGEELDRLRRQYAVLGFSGGPPPHGAFSPGPCKARAPSRRVICPNTRDGGCDLAGWLITGKTVFTAKLEPMQFLTFEDETGLVEATFFPEAYRRFHMTLDWERPYLLGGQVEENFGAVTLTVESVEKL